MFIHLYKLRLHYLWPNSNQTFSHVWKVFTILGDLVTIIFFFFFFFFFSGLCVSSLMSYYPTPLLWKNFFQHLPTVKSLKEFISSQQLVCQVGLETFFFFFFHVVNSTPSSLEYLIKYLFEIFFNFFSVFKDSFGFIHRSQISTLYHVQCKQERLLN